MAAYDDGYGGGGGQMQLALPPLTLWVKRLLIANVVIFLAMFTISFAKTIHGPLVDFLGVNPSYWRSFIPAIWQPFTYAFVHDLNTLQHLFFNMLGLYFFGTMLESMIGPRRFIVFYLSAAAVGAVLQIAYMLAIGDDSTTVGASGAVMGVIVAAAVLQPQLTVLFIFIPVKLWVLASALVAFDVFPLLLQLRDGVPPGRVAHMVHLGGAFFGFLAAYRKWIWKDPLAAVERRRAVAQTERRMADDAKMDQLLAKISREGLGSLTRSEKAFLQKRSEGKR